MIYQLKSNKDTLHGFLSSSLKPVLEIESGDTVLFQTLEADWRIHDTNIRSSIEGDFFLTELLSIPVMHYAALYS